MYKVVHVFAPQIFQAPLWKYKDFDFLGPSWKYKKVGWRVWIEEGRVGAARETI
jgi:hypothetical protein